MAVTVLQRIASTQQIGLLLVPAIKGFVYINTHSNYSQPDLLNYTMKILVGIVTPLQRARDLLEPVKLTIYKAVIEKVTIVKSRMDNGGCNGAGCSEVKIWADTVKFMDMIVARFGMCRDLVREGRVR